MLWTALFADETLMEQTKEDVSKINPQKSQFFDVLEKEKDVQLLFFALSDEKNTYLLDLRDGRWEINGISMYFNDKKYTGPNINRLIYYKSRGTLFSEVGPISNLPDIYNIGFQTNELNGENIKQILQISPNSICNFII